LGPDHLHLATTLGNLGRVLVRQENYQSARLHHQRALTITQKALGPDHPHVAYSLIGLARAALGTGDPASARAYAERAVSIREAATVTPVSLAEARFVLARALWSTPSEQPRARTLAEQARDMLVTVEDRSEAEGDLADIEAWLAEHRVNNK
ncbi:MAG: tetratricopeptide repeat protein, partial [Myxococcota bacterium]